MFSGLKDAFWQLLVPVLGQQVVMTRVVRGDVLTIADWAFPAAIAFAIAAGSVALVARLLRDERIVFGRT
jgi:sodium transport system permease protein